jgi:hypothetical protein
MGLGFTRMQSGQTVLPENYRWTSVKRVANLAALNAFINTMER